MKQYALVVKQDEMSANIAEKIKKGLTGIMEYNPDDPDLVISVGGDGTMLLSVHQYMEQKVTLTRLFFELFFDYGSIHFLF